MPGARAVLGRILHCASTRDPIMHIRKQRRRRGGREKGGGALLLAVVLTLTACDSLLEVTLPGSTPADALEDPQFAPILIAGAVGNFECAYTNYALLSGAVNGELIGAQTFLGLVPYQRRDVRAVDTGFGEDTCSSTTGLYTPVSVARFVTDDAFERISAMPEAEVPNRTDLLAQAALYAGYSYVVFGEGFCSAAFDGGAEVQPQVALERAVERFTTALELANQVNDASLRNTAYVGRARAQMSLGQLAAAVADAEQITDERFVRNISRSPAGNTRWNKIHRSNGPDLQLSVDPSYWDLTWSGDPDPRVRVDRMLNSQGGQLRGQDGLTPMYKAAKHATDATPIRLASYVEAQLIIAEVEGGQVAVEIINDLLEAAGLSGNFVSTDEDEILEMVREQRRREFFLEGQRIGDLRRYGGTAFQDATAGEHPYTGETYGGMTCFPLPLVEIQNNPNVPG